MDIKNKKFLLIGGAGLIGSHTLEALLQEDVAQVFIYDNFSRGCTGNIEEALKDPRVSVFPLGGEILNTDILNEAMQDVDGVFHFAALWLLHCQDYPRSAFEVNIRGTFNVLESLIRNKVKRLVYSSSASVYGDAINEPMTEEHPYNNLTFYGATKIAGEHMCRSLYHRYKDTANHFDYVGLRYMNVYGQRQDYNGAYIAVIMKILDKIYSGESPVVYGDGSQAYDFIDVRDCAKANVCAMKAGVTDEFYNVGTGVRTTIKELTELLLELTHSKLPITFQPETGTQAFVKNRVASVDKSYDGLEFKASVDLKNGLKQLIRWYKQVKNI